MHSDFPRATQATGLPNAFSGSVGAFHPLVEQGIKWFPLTNHKS